MSDFQLFSIIINKSIKDDAVDIVLNSNIITGFTMSQVFGYSRKHAKYDIREQVEGYKNFYRLDIIHKTHELDELLTAFKQLDSQFKLKYWVSPISDFGEI
ncbi:DUF3240 family protein [Marinicella sp. S1101]|uniref:DUF3240 family protein n=1 Tax=Marinicella marina TaxID=2996016 RepID=UPI00226083CB|nr:DUF3240 family protein [Marinicella marina]MCX7554196.1 DUF3240 family protein [Marinicella marina]MDJ1141111.1 DUF3240 family protein [Marinicella marina]